MISPSLSGGIAAILFDLHRRIQAYENYWFLFARTGKIVGNAHETANLQPPSAQHFRFHR
jgi:hypothetical protein